MISFNPNWGACSTLPSDQQGFDMTPLPSKWVSINGHVTKIVIPLSPSRPQALGIAKWICILLSSICQELNSWLVFLLYMLMIFSLLCKGFSLPTCIKIWPCVDWIYIIFSIHLVYEKKKRKERACCQNSQPNPCIIAYACFTFGDFSFLYLFLFLTFLLWKLRKRVFEQTYNTLAYSLHFWKLIEAPTFLWNAQRSSVTNFI